MEQVEPTLLYGPDDKPLTADHPLYQPALARYRSRLHRTIDEFLLALPAGKLRSLEQLEKALRTALESREIAFHLDTGKLDIPEMRLGRVRIKGPVPVYGFVKALAAALAALNLLDWLSLPAVQGAGRESSRNPRDGLEYVWIPAGSFQMGCVPSDSKGGLEEKPRHRIVVSSGFWISSTAVTVRAYREYCKKARAKMPKPPDSDSSWQRNDHPIENVSWNDAKAYCEWAGGRLPTEAEWEYAARGGMSGRIYPWGNNLSRRDANYANDPKWKGTSPVREYPPNGLGLYDMVGNVREWCSDWYSAQYYRNSPQSDPKGPSEGTYRVLRGGAWSSPPNSIRVSYRIRSLSDDSIVGIGVRCVLDSPP